MLGVTRIIMVHIFIGIFYKDAWKEHDASFPLPSSARHAFNAGRNRRPIRGKNDGPEIGV